MISLLHSCVTIDSISRLYVYHTIVQAEHAVDHGHEIITFQSGLSCLVTLAQYTVGCGQIYLFFFVVFCHQVFVYYIV